jgi:hypothetical protein
MHGKQRAIVPVESRAARLFAPLHKAQPLPRKSQISNASGRIAKRVQSKDAVFIRVEGRTATPHSC